MSRSHLKLNLQRSSYNRVTISGIEQDPRIQEQSTELLKGSRKKQEKLRNDEVDYINYGEEDQMEIYGYRMHPFKTGFTWLFIFLSGGLLRLLFHWFPQWMLYCTHSQTTLKDATRILVVETYQDQHKSLYVKPIEIISSENISNMSMEKNSEDDQVLRDISLESKTPKLEIHLGNGIFKEMNSARIFDCKKCRYIWDENRNEFLRLVGLDHGVSCAYFHEQFGLNLEQQRLRRLVYRSNEMAVPVRGIVTLLFLEVLNPFYIFQFLSFGLWFADDYVYYASTILIMSLISVIISVIQTRKNQLRLHSTVHSRDVCTVVRGGGRGGQAETIPTEHLVPGDLLVLPPHGCVMFCDAVLLSGTCIVNESMLTGESVPVTKTPLPQNSNMTYDSKEHARHTIFCGTHVIQTRYYSTERVYALVLRTGFDTTKGALVRSILYPPPVDFKFEKDSYRFVTLLAAIASIGAVYTVVTKVLAGKDVISIAFESLDLITIVVPPALPAAMTIGNFYAQHRLQQKGIYCISPRTISISGSVDCVCFDKTGTLTEDGLDMWGVVPVQSNRFIVPVKQIVTLDIRDHLLIAMATCHSLTLIDEAITGDPLDIKMFESTEWILEEPKVGDSSKFDMLVPKVVRPPSTRTDISDLEVGIMREFPFSSSLQRMSVVTRSLDSAHFHVYCKGAPETLLSLSDPKSVPTDLSSVLEEYTEEGYRVLAVAHKPLDLNYVQAQRFDRKHFESNLIFSGLLIMENRLKPQSSHVIRQLTSANIRNIMVTGDNVLTALSVARDCGIIRYGERVLSVNATANGLRYSLASSCLSNVPSVNNSQNSNVLDKSNPSSTIENTQVAVTLEHSASFSSERAILPSPLGPPQSPVFPPENRYCFAVTGHAWNAARLHCPEILPFLVTRGAVFARMSPDQKQQLIQELQGLGYFVAMCGDGANDCGALKAAHAGISLSDAESSVASPFTSKNPDISCVPEVIREGRAALVTSFGIFKYMAAYSLTQFVSVMILYSIDGNLTDGEYLYIDLFIITTFSFFFGRTEAYDGPLYKRPPSLSLISLAPVLSLILQIIIVILLQVSAFFLVKHNSWFVPFSDLDTEELSGYENYAVFFISSMQYIILASVFSKGAPYRQAFFKNKGFLFTLVLFTGFTLYLICAPSEWLSKSFELRMPPENTFIFILVGLVVLNFVLAFFIEYFIIDYLVSNKWRNKFSDPIKSGCKYLLHDNSLTNNTNWPPISQSNSEGPLLSSAQSSDEAIPCSPRPKLTCIIEVPLDCKSLESKRSRHYSEGSGPGISSKNNQTEFLRGSDQNLSRY